MDGFPNQQLYLNKVVYKSSAMRQPEAMVMVSCLKAVNVSAGVWKLNNHPLPPLPPPHVDVNPTSFWGL